MTTALLEFKKKYLDNTHYILSRLWRAVYSLYSDKQKACDGCKFYWNNYCHSESYNSWIKEELLVNPKPIFRCKFFKFNLSILAATYDVNCQDIQYIKENKIVAESDLPTIIKFEDSINIPNTDTLNTVISETKSFVTYKVRKKLLFIWKYNRFLDPEDFIFDVTASVIRSLVANDYINDKDQLTAIARNKVNQEICNIINKYTAKKRTTLVETSDGWEPTLLSLDFSYENDNNNVNLHGLIGAGIDINESALNEAFITRIIEKSDPDEQTFVKINVLGHIPDDLQKFSLAKTGKSFKNLKANVAHRIVMTYLGWSKDILNRFKNKISRLIGEK